MAEKKVTRGAGVSKRKEVEARGAVSAKSTGHAVLAAERTVRKEGKLRVTVPLRPFTLSDGEVVAREAGIEHPLLIRLSGLAAKFQAISRRTANEETTAVATILTALVGVVRHPEAGQTLKEPFEWGARVLSQKGLPDDVIAEAGTPPLLHAAQRLPLAPAKSIAAGFDYVVEQLTRIIRACREEGRPFNEASTVTSVVIASAFRGIRTLTNASKVPPELASPGDPFSELCDRIREQLANLGRNHQATDAKTAATDIAETLIRAEMKLSGWPKAKITSAFGFLAVRTTRAGKA